MNYLPAYYVTIGDCDIYLFSVTLKSQKAIRIVIMTKQFLFMTLTYYKMLSNGYVCSCTVTHK